MVCGGLCAKAVWQQSCHAYEAGGTSIPLHEGRQDLCLACAMAASMYHHPTWTKHTRVQLHDMRSMHISCMEAVQAWRYSGGQSGLLGCAFTTMHDLEKGPSSEWHLHLSGGKGHILTACHPPCIYV